MDGDTGSGSRGANPASGQGPWASRETVRPARMNFPFRPAVLNDLFRTARNQHRAAIQLRPAYRGFEVGVPDHVPDRKRRIHVPAAGLKHDRKSLALQTPQKLLKLSICIRFNDTFCGYPLNAAYIAIAVPNQNEIHRPFFGRFLLCGARRGANQGQRRKETCDNQAKDCPQAQASCHDGNPHKQKKNPRALRLKRSRSPYQPVCRQGIIRAFG